jgi:chromosome segregation ATPase
MAGAERQDGVTRSACERELSRLLGEQAELLEHLASLGQRQRELGEREDPSELLALMDAREGVIERLGALGERVAPLRAQWREERPRMQPGGGEVETRAERVSRLAREIAERDARDQEAFAQRRASLAEELSRTGQGRRASGAYLGRGTGEASASPVFKDFQA